jgi:hypothetical protein
MYHHHTTAEAIELGCSTHTRDGKGRDFCRNHPLRLKQCVTQVIKEMVRETDYTFTTYRSWSRASQVDLVLVIKETIPSPPTGAAAQGFSSRLGDSNKRDYTITAPTGAAAQVFSSQPRDGNIEIVTKGSYPFIYLPPFASLSTRQ